MVALRVLDGRDHPSHRVWETTTWPGPSGSLVAHRRLRCRGREPGCGARSAWFPVPPAVLSRRVECHLPDRDWLHRLALWGTRVGIGPGAGSAVSLAGSGDLARTVATGCGQPLVWLRIGYRLPDAHP